MPLIQELGTLVQHSVMQPDFRKWGPPWVHGSQKMGPTSQNAGLSSVGYNTPFDKNRDFNFKCGDLATLQKLRAHIKFCRKSARLRSGCIPEHFENAFEY